MVDKASEGSLFTMKPFSPVFISQKKNADKSFYDILLLTFSVVSITSVLLLAGFFSVNYFTSISSSTKKYNQQLLAQTNYTIKEMQENTDHISCSLLSNDKIISFLSLTAADNTTIPVLASQEISQQLLLLPYVDSIYLYNANLDLLYSSKSGHMQAAKSFEEQDIVSRLWDRSFIDNYHGELVPSFGSDTSSVKTLTYYVFDSYSSSTEEKSAIIINIAPSALTNSISSMKTFISESEVNFLLLDSDMTYISSVLSDAKADDDFWIDCALEALRTKKNPDSPYIKINGTLYFQTYTNQNVYGWNLFCFIPAGILFRNIFRTALISVLIVICILIFALHISRYSAKRLNKPFEMLTQNLAELHSDNAKNSMFKTKEFQTILSAMSTMENNNKHLQAVLQKTRYSMTQSFLNNLVLHRYVDAPQLIEPRLKELHLDYLLQEQLCMAVFKIDNYHAFFTEHSPDGLWAIQFSVVNIIEELAHAEFPSGAFSCGNDKFVLLIACDSEPDLVAFEDKLTLLLQLIQEKIDTYLHFTMSVSYSRFFKSIYELPDIYEAVEHALLLKIRHGHAAIIDPYQIDDIPEGDFQLSPKLTEQLIGHLLNGQFESAWDAYGALTENLFYYDYDEVLSTVTRLIYNTYEHFLQKYPMLKDTAASALKDCLARLEYAEISDDVCDLSHSYFEALCLAVQKLKEHSGLQKSAVITEKILQIIEERHNDPSLCLASIAESIGLSANYIGQMFKQTTQKSVSQYLLEIRMEKVSFYLQTTSLPLNKILDEVGLEKTNYFYTQFKKYFGMSLSEYRQKFKTTSENTSETM